ncbi:peroxiredoxin [Acidobacteriota bacterium]
MNEQNPIKVGGVAPDFALKDQNKEEFHLSEHRGQRVLLSFHPLAWTGVCAKQMKALDRHQDVFSELNTVAVGLSIDSVPAKYSWAKQLEITRTRLLSDFWPHGQVAKQFGIFREKDGFSERANIIVDTEGKVEFVKIYEIPELPDIEEIISFLKG